MKKLRTFGIIAGAAILAAAPLSLQWSKKTVAFSLDSAEARIGRPLTATSVAGVSRRVHRRPYRRAVYGTAVAGGYGYYSYSSPAYSSYYAPYSHSYSYTSPYSYSYSNPLTAGWYYTPYSFYAYSQFRRPYFGLGWLFY
jgi:hypothetical protein